MTASGSPHPVDGTFTAQRPDPPSAAKQADGQSGAERVATDPAGADPPHAEPADGPLLPKRPDGRSARWAEHRATRRAELIDAAIVAIGRHGTTAGMDQIAAAAGTSKPVIYRYFSDKSDLHRAMTHRVTDAVLATLARTISEDPTPRELIQTTVDACFGLLQQHPDLFRFVTAHPAVVDEATGQQTHFATVVAALVADQLTPALARSGIDPVLAGPWGAAVVGFIRDAGLWWLDHPGRIDHAALAAGIGALLWGGAAGVERDGALAAARPTPTS